MRLIGRVSLLFPRLCALHGSMRWTFSKVSFLSNLQCNMTVALTFQKCILHVHIACYIFHMTFDIFQLLKWLPDLDEEDLCVVMKGNDPLNGRVTGD